MELRKVRAQTGSTRQRHLLRGLHPRVAARAAHASLEGRLGAKMATIVGSWAIGRHKVQLNGMVVTWFSSME